MTATPYRAPMPVRPAMPSAAPGRGAGAVLIAATALAGLVAGVYFCYSISIMPGLAGAGDRTFIEVMQRTNEAIENPVFFAAFFGAPVLLAIALVQHRRRAARPVLWWLLAAFVLHGIGFLVTTGVEVPLNDALAAAGDPAHLADPAGVRDRFETPWLVWHAVRTVTSAAALVGLGAALVRHGRSRRAAR